MMWRCLGENIDFTVTSTGAYLFGGGGPTTLVGGFYQGTQTGFPNYDAIGMSAGEGADAIDLGLPPATFTDLAVASISLGTVTQVQTLVPDGGNVVYPTVTLTVSTAAPVPEPGTVALFGLSIGGLAVAQRRKRERTARRI